MEGKDRQEGGEKETKGKEGEEGEGREKKRGEASVTFELPDVSLPRLPLSCVLCSVDEITFSLAF